MVWLSPEFDVEFVREETKKRDDVGGGKMKRKGQAGPRNTALRACVRARFVDSVWLFGTRILVYCVCKS